MVSQALSLLTRPTDDFNDERATERITRGGKHVKEELVKFLSEFECPNAQERIDSLRARINAAEEEEDVALARQQMLHFPHGPLKYLNALQAITNRFSHHLEIAVDDYILYCEKMRDDDANLPDDEWLGKYRFVYDILTLHSTRALRILADAAELVRSECTQTDSASVPLFHPSDSTCMTAETLEAHLRAPFQVTLSPPLTLDPDRGTPLLPVRGIRDIQETSFGTLMRFEVIIAKVFSARPRMSVAVLQCNLCDAKAFQPINDDEFNPQRICMSNTCATRGTSAGECELIERESKYTLEEVILAQEPASHVPQGNVPQRRKMIVEGVLARKLIPGVQATITGIPVPKLSNRPGQDISLGGKVRDTVIHVQHISVHKTSAHLGEDDQAELDRRVNELAPKGDTYERLANSIAPSVWGHDDVKKALLLQLVGAPKLDTHAGLNVRGEVHILMMGDPGVAKSQLLGKMTKLAPRASYTSGKSASGVGLTASVFKDPQTGEFCLEGGAVVIADTGICGIDEFDKLDEGDRTAIHEVMEQQTVSISKAGLNVQLNARTAILAAANPTFGRYDTTKSVMENIKLPYSLISRFDLQFLMLDNPNEADDRHLAQHILQVHHRAKMVDLEPDALTIDPTTLRHYVMRCQKVRPTVEPAVATIISQKYVDLRAQERLQYNLTGQEEGYTTPRTLFSIIRLAQARARVRFSPTVSAADVEEAVRLMESSKSSIKKARDGSGARQDDHVSDPIGEILDLLRRLDRTHYGDEGYTGWMNVAEAEQQGVQNGYSKQQVNETIRQYAQLHLIHHRPDSMTFGFMDVIDQYHQV